MKKNNSKRKALYGALFVFALIVSTIIFMLKRKTGWLYVVNESEYAPYREWIVAMSRVETANWKSKVFRADNNLFGMKVPEFREHLGTRGTPAPSSENVNGKQTYYLNFPSWDQSAKDFLMYLRAVKMPTDFVTPDEFVYYLKSKGYFGIDADAYLKQVDYWLTKPY